MVSRCGPVAHGGAATSPRTRHDPPGSMSSRRWHRVGWRKGFPARGRRDRANCRHRCGSPRQGRKGAAKCLKDGGPGAIRTHDLPLRRGTLYPAELRGHGRHSRMKGRMGRPAPAWRGRAAPAGISEMTPSFVSMPSDSPTGGDGTHAGHGHPCRGCPDVISSSSGVATFPRANAKCGSGFSASQRTKIRCEAKSCLDKN